MISVNDIIMWAEDNKYFQGLKIEEIHHLPPIDDAPAFARFDMMGRDRVGRFSLWEKQNVDIEILSVATNTTIAYFTVNLELEDIQLNSLVETMSNLIRFGIPPQESMYQSQ